MIEKRREGGELPISINLSILANIVEFVASCILWEKRRIQFRYADTNYF